MGAFDFLNFGGNTNQATNYTDTFNQQYDAYVKSFDPNAAGGFDNLLTKDAFAKNLGLSQQQSGMTAGNWAGLGLGAVNLGFGIANKRKELGIAQGNLDLSRSKFKFLQDNQAAVRANTQADNAKAQAMVDARNV